MRNAIQRLALLPIVALFLLPAACYQIQLRVHWRNALYLPTPYDFTNPYNYADFRRNELLKINLTEFRFPYQYLNDIEWADSPTPLLCNSMTSNGKGGLSHQCGLSMNEG